MFYVDSEGKKNRNDNDHDVDLISNISNVLYTFNITYIHIEGKKTRKDDDVDLISNISNILNIYSTLNIFTVRKRRTGMTIM